MILAAFGKMGVMELVIILIIILVIFGPKQIPKLAKMFGKTAKGFKEGIEEGLKDDNVSASAAGDNASEVKVNSTSGNSAAEH